MKKNYLILSLLVINLIVLNTACTSNKSNEQVQQADTVKTEIVRTIILGKTNISRTIDYTSTLAAFKEIHLAPASPGRIEKIYVEVSDRVIQGQILVQMDRTQLQQAKINMLSLETDFKRLEELKKTESIADQQYDQIKARYEIAKSSFDFLSENTQLKAPFSGIISGKYFEDGEIYSGSPVASIGKPAVLSIIQINNLKSQVNISSMYFPSVSLGLKADIISDLYPDKPFKGEIFRIYPTIDNSSKTFVVEIKIQNDNLKLRPGMFAKVRINFGEGSALLVPSIALIKQTGTNDMYVYINENNIAIKKLVKIGSIINDKTEIIEGLSIGDELIVVGQNKLENKTPIKISK
jgi:RND family efflux transporter MFP subunit